LKAPQKQGARADWLTGLNRIVQAAGVAPSFFACASAMGSFTFFIR
jgi:hypothetical protein